ncbi:MAG: acyl carrier protein [Acidobacteriota bacterium]|nr:acyl carrier protein [Acidobacteriota bacterium]
MTPDPHEQIVAEIIEFIVDNNPVSDDDLPLPRDESLYQKGILDSTGVIELVDFIERRWSIKIRNEEITLEKFGSLNKMARLARSKMEAKVVAN